MNLNDVPDDQGGQPMCLALSPYGPMCKLPLGHDGDHAAPRIPMTWARATSARDSLNNSSILPFSRRSPWRRDGRLPGPVPRVAIAERPSTLESARNAHPSHGAPIVTAGPTCREGVAGIAPSPRPAVTAIDPIIGVDVHNIAMAVRLPSGELDSQDGDIWWRMGGHWYCRRQSAVRPVMLVTIPQVIAALDEREVKV